MPSTPDTAFAAGIIWNKGALAPQGRPLVFVNPLDYGGRFAKKRGFWLDYEGFAAAPPGLQAMRDAIVVAGFDDAMAFRAIYL